MQHSSSIDRRQFLMHTTAAAATLGAPYVVPATALGRAGRAAPSERLTMGFIGVGNMGGGHLGAFLGIDEVQIVAICDVDAVKRENACQKVNAHYAAKRPDDTFSGCDGYNEFERLLARDDIDAVLIAVPDHWHAIIAVAAARAGKDVYCEKPLALTIHDARAMVRAARRYGRVFQTGSQQRSSPEFRKACEFVRSERIGRLETVVVNIGPPSRDKCFPTEPVRPGLDWDRWLGPAPWMPYNSERCSGSYSDGWRRVRDYSGGMTTDWGAHHFDIGQWGMGMDGTGPVEIIPPPQRDGVGLTFRYANGVTMVRDNKYEDHNVNGLLFVGSDGWIEVNRGYLRIWPDDIGREPLGADDVHLYESPGHRQDWLNCIQNRRRPICDVAIGCSSVTVCHLGNIAYWMERPIRYDPDSGNIVGDASAARWIDRPKRAPWRL